MHKAKTPQRNIHRRLLALILVQFKMTLNNRLIIEDQSRWYMCTYRKLSVLDPRVGKTYKKASRISTDVLIPHFLGEDYLEKTPGAGGSTTCSQGRQQCGITWSRFQFGR